MKSEIPRNSEQHGTNSERTAKIKVTFYTLGFILLHLNVNSFISDHKLYLQCSELLQYNTHYNKAFTKEFSRCLIQIPDENLKFMYVQLFFSPEIRSYFNTFSAKLPLFYHFNFYIKSLGSIRLQLNLCQPLASIATKHQSFKYVGQRLEVRFTKNFQR